MCEVLPSSLVSVPLWKLYSPCFQEEGGCLPFQRAVLSEVLREILCEQLYRILHEAIFHIFVLLSF